METYRREFLQKISGAAFLAASPSSILGTAGNGPTQEDSRSSGDQTLRGLEGLHAQFPLWHSSGIEIALNPSMRQIGIGTLAPQFFLIAEFHFDPRNKS